MIERVPTMRQENKERLGIPDFIEYEERPAPEALYEQFKKAYGLEKEEAAILIGYLQDLNLSLADLDKKDILDVGSGPSIFKKAVKKVGNAHTITAFDHGVVQRAMDVQGKATALPFKKESFDVVLARHSVPGMDASAGRFGLIQPTLREMFRVVRRGGMIKISNVGGGTMNEENLPKPYNISRSKMRTLVLDEIVAIHNARPNIRFKIIKLSDSDEGVYKLLLEVWT